MAYERASEKNFERILEDICFVYHFTKSAF